MSVSTDLVWFNVIALGKPQAIISEEAAKEMEAERDQSFSGGYGNRRDPMPRPLSAADGNNTSKLLCKEKVNHTVDNDLWKNG